MASRRAQIAMTDAEVHAFLDSQKVLNVATLGATGHPHLVAMWYALIDGGVCFWTFAKSQKVVNLRRDHRITGLVESGDTYETLRGVELIGSGRLVDDYDEILAIGKAVAVRYAGPAAVGDAALPFIEAQARKRVGVELVVDRVVSWDHTKLAGSY